MSKIQIEQQLKQLRHQNMDDRNLPAILRDVLAMLACEDKGLHDLLVWHYIDDEKIWTIANRLAVQERTVYVKKKQALARLEEILTEQEEAKRHHLRHHWQDRLEAPTYQALYGVTQQSSTLAAQLQQPKAPWLIAIEGIGGIGKTALADQIVRTLIDPLAWADLAWVTARQRVLNLGGALRDLPQSALTLHALVDALAAQLLVAAPLPSELPLAQKLSALRKHCRQQRCLIVIDNLETVADVDALIETLESLCNPTKILITSRQQVTAASGIFTLRPHALEEADALLLLRSEAALRNLPHLAQANDATLRRIYAVVGGHPLALRLTVGQTYLYPLATVLENLRAARSQATQNLYQYIYQQTWETLDVVARHLLLILLTASERGATLDYLSAVTSTPGLPLPAGLTSWTHYDLLRGLETLVRLNLVDRRGDLNTSYYTIHSLTRAFLHEQVLRW